MPVLINNYTLKEPSRVPLREIATVPTIAEFEPFYSSTIFSFDKRMNLNSRILKLLNEYSSLESNWDGDDGLQPDNLVVQKAKNFTRLLDIHGQSIFHAAPGPNGEIMLDIRNSNKTKSLEVLFYPTRSVVVMFPEEGVPTQQNFEQSQLPELLNWLNKK